MKPFDLSKKQITYSLFGLLLGDGWIQNLRTERKNKQLVIQHSMKQEKYTRWLESLFKIWGIYRYSHYNQKKMTTFGELEYCTVCSDLLGSRHFLKYNRFYDNDYHKIMSEYILKRITPLGLLFWFLDDGYLTIKKRESLSKKTNQDDCYRITRFAGLSTYSYSYESHLNAQKLFKERFNIDVKIHHFTKNNKIFYKLYFSAENFRKFYEIVRPYICYIPENMQYKFDMKYNPNRVINVKGGTKKAVDINFTNYNIPLRIASKKDDEIVHSVLNISKETV